MKINGGAKLILLILFIILMIKLGMDSFKRAKEVKSLLLMDVNAEIIRINPNQQQLSNDKFRMPESCNEVLFKLVNTDNYFTINSCAEKYYSNIDVSGNWTYRHKIGDTCYFELLNKNRLFKIEGTP